MNRPNLEWVFKDKWYRREADNPCSSCGNFHQEGEGKALRTEARNRPVYLELRCICPIPASFPGERFAIVDCLDPHFRSDMHRDIASGLCRVPKSIPSKYLYDAQGSKLFDEICTLPEYYPTRTELEILETYAAGIMDFFDGREGDLVEIGSGSDLKVRRLLNALPRSRLSKIRYVPMDISRTGLVQSSLRILRDFEGLHICGIVGDFTRHLDRLPRGRKLITFFGGTFGNFHDSQGVALLENMARTMGTEDRLLIGIDMLKDMEILDAAYNDSLGVTARFNLNILSHVNQVMGSDLSHHDFEHRAFFNPYMEQIEMHLRARREVWSELRRIGLPVHIAPGETIHTEISRKFSREKAENIFRRAGLSLAEWYTDKRKWFSLVSLRSNHCQ